MGDKISIVIPHYPFDAEIDAKLAKCVASLTGYHELIVVVNHGDGFAKSVNRGLKLAKGDYIMVVNNDIEMTEGTLEMLAVPNTVTSPRSNGWSQPFWGSFFCIPRNVYERIGGLDEQFEIGYYEDDDYIKRLELAGIPMKCIEECNIVTFGGATMKLFNVKELSEANKDKFLKKWGTQ